MVETYLRTKDLADAIGMSVQQVRNDEANGLMPPVERSPSGYRRYTQQHLQSLLTARRMLPAYEFIRTQQIMQATHTGRLSDALAVIDERHAELDYARTQLDQTLETLGVIASQLPPSPHARGARRVRVGTAAREVGVRISALRFWEQMGLLHPVREAESNYRIYDDRQLRRLRIITLLRQTNYDFEAIRTTLDELEAGQPDRAMAAVEQRRHAVAQTSWRCIDALAAFHRYVETYIGAPTNDQRPTTDEEPTTDE